MKIVSQKNITNYLGKEEQYWAFELLKIIISLQESRDFYTSFHQEKVSEIAVSIAKKMGLNGKAIFNIKACALIHDVGKITLPPSLLNKTANLIPEEFELIKTHTTSKYLEQFKQFSNTLTLYEVITQHHERIDGSGYPYGLKSNEICLEAKLIAVADVFDAISTDRPYRKSLGKQHAYDYICSNENILFDKDVVNAFKKIY